MFMDDPVDPCRLELIVVFEGIVEGRSTANQTVQRLNERLQQIVETEYPQVKIVESMAKIAEPEDEEDDGRGGERRL